jgi:hypothetical protein
VAVFLTGLLPHWTGNAEWTFLVYGPASLFCILIECSLIYQLERIRNAVCKAQDSRIGQELPASNISHLAKVARDIRIQQAILVLGGTPATVVFPLLFFKVIPESYLSYLFMLVVETGMSAFGALRLAPRVRRKDKSVGERELVASPMTTADHSSMVRHSNVNASLASSAKSA